MNRSEFYKALVADFVALVGDSSDVISNTANLSSLLFTRLRAEYGESATNWAGFYFRSSPTELKLGPFCGEPACQLLRFNKGVCGAAARDKKTLLVKDVHAFPGHVACDERSNSELVVPLFFKPAGKDPIVIAVLDMDSPKIGGFSECDQEHCEKLVQILQEKCDFQRLLNYYSLDYNSL
ncbi:unnamed protein product [Oikopleura dioica]|uniref:GAF domain-containing protein n=1 Tax=Oikopleura dioica TaxID=34765 RepID=E4XVG0_OIKDI|nr:unnamed protein product [Oikopleura dioica]